MKWYWQLTIILLSGLAIFFFTQIWQFIKYYIFWEFSKQWIEFTLNPIWQKAGVIEIIGGAETGKTLLITLLTSNLKGRKWSNVPNIIPGWQELKLSTLKKHWVGEYEEGLVGVNNVLLIDESWLFFSSRKLEKNGLTKKSLSSLVFFLSETSKNNFKIFYVNKQELREGEAVNLLSTHKSAVIRTLGIRNYCRIWGKSYYYLDIEFDTRPSNLDNGLSKKNKTKQKVKYEINADHRIKKTEKSWFSWFSTNPHKKVISIPFSQDDLQVFDKTWNLDSTYARQRMISIIDKLAADGLIEGLKYKQSRTQKLQEENEILLWWKKHPDKNRRGQMQARGWMIIKERGLWKPAEVQINEEEEELKKKFKMDKISREEYEEKIAKIFERRVKLNIKIEKEKKLSENQEAQEDDPFKEVSIKEGKEKPKQNDEE